MTKRLAWCLVPLTAVFLWGALNFMTTTKGWFLEPIAQRGNSKAFMDKIKEAIDSNYQGNATMLLMENGEVVATHHVSKGKPVHADSIFGVASLGKWVAAVGIMKLVEQGKLELDLPVSQYLTRWQLPPSEFNNNGVTVRRLLSHTAGITDRLGHDGFPPGTPVQPLTEHLTLAADREPDKDGRVMVGMEPGTEWQYSGGSYNLLQLIVEEVSRQTFSDYMQEAVFQHLGMNDSSYVVDRDAMQTAEYFGENQTLQIYPNYTSLAATGLYSTTSDLAKFVASQIPSSILANSSQRLLSDASILDMHQSLGNTEGLDIWGAGVMLYADNNEGSFIVGHGGRSPMLNATARMNPATGNAFIMIQTGNKRAFASRMATKWTTWETGRPDMFQLQYGIPQMLKRVVIGTVAILLMTLLAGGFLYYRKRRKN